jgi:phage baseplate assembly protein W
MKKVLKITDLSYDFLPHPVTGNILFVKNEQAIKQSIKTLIFLNLYEKPYNPTIDVGINSYLFEQINLVEVDKLKKSIETTLEQYEPRIILDDVIVYPEEEKNSLNITINYTIIGELPTPDSVSFIFGRSR